MPVAARALERILYHRLTEEHQPSTLACQPAVCGESRCSGACRKRSESIVLAANPTSGDLPSVAQLLVASLLGKFHSAASAQCAEETKVPHVVFAQAWAAAGPKGPKGVTTAATAHVSISGALVLHVIVVPVSFRDNWMRAPVFFDREAVEGTAQAVNEAGPDQAQAVGQSRRWKGGRAFEANSSLLESGLASLILLTSAIDGPWRERLWRQKPARLDTFVRIRMDSAS
jgi:hypothetical protein